MSDFCDPMDCSMPGSSVLYYVLEFTQIHVHWVSDVIYSSHPLSSSSPPAFSLSQHQGLLQMNWLFPSGSQIIGASSASASVLPMSIQGWFPLRLTVLISLQSRDSQVSSLAPQFKGINSLSLCLLYSPALTTVHDHWEDHSLDYTSLCQKSNVSAFQPTV